MYRLKQIYNNYKTDWKRVSSKNTILFNKNKYFTNESRRLIQQVLPTVWYYITFNRLLKM